MVRGTTRRRGTTCNMNAHSRKCVAIAAVAREATQSRAGYENGSIVQPGHGHNLRRSDSHGTYVVRDVALAG